MVNLNISLPDDLHKQIKVAAASNGKTIKELINEALEQRSWKKRRFK